MVEPALFRYPSSGIHYAATLLDPRFKTLHPFVDPGSRGRVQKEAFTFLKKHIPEGRASDVEEEEVKSPVLKKKQVNLFVRFLPFYNLVLTGFLRP